MHARNALFPLPRAMKGFGSRFRSRAATVHPRFKGLECSCCQSSGFGSLSVAFLNRKDVQVRYIFEVLHDHDLSTGIMAVF